MTPDTSDDTERGRIEDTMVKDEKDSRMGKSADLFLEWKAVNTVSI